jgi:hypothetical protein
MKPSMVLSSTLSFKVLGRAVGSVAGLPKVGVCGLFVFFRQEACSQG